MARFGVLRPLHRREADDGVNSIINTRTIVTGADGIPLDAYGPGGAQAVLSLFALLALGQLTLAVVGVIALVRYRAMIPLVFLIFLAEHLARRGLLALNPIDRTDGAPIGLYINLALAAVLLAGLVLSTWRAHRIPGAGS